MPQFFVNVSMEGYFTVWADDEASARETAEDLTRDGAKPSGLEIELVMLREVERIAEADDDVRV